MYLMQCVIGTIAAVVVNTWMDPGFPGTYLLDLIEWITSIGSSNSEPWATFFVAVFAEA